MIHASMQETGSSIIAIPINGLLSLVLSCFQTWQICAFNAFGSLHPGSWVTLLSHYYFFLFYYFILHKFHLKYHIVLSRSKGEAKATFLRHEGFLGALGAFMSYEKHGLNDLTAHLEQTTSTSDLGDKFACSILGDSNDHESIECHVYATPQM